MSDPRVAIVVQARMGSSRLPGKVLAPIAGRPLLELLLERLERVSTPHQLVVATSHAARDDAIAAFCARAGVPCLRGSEDDVLDRFAGAARALEADVVVRVTGDCPLIDPEIVDRVLRRFLSGGCDYASNTLERRDPRGLDVEVVSREALARAAADATDPAEREHVTLHLYRRPDRFRLCSVPGAEDASGHRWTVDTHEDLEFVRRICAALVDTRPGFGRADVLELLARNPELVRINRDVVQRVV